MAGPSPRLFVVPASREPRLLRFSGVTLDRHAGLVRRGTDVLALRPKAFDVLAYVVAHRGRLISRLELLQAIWPDVTVTDDSLVQCLVEIRRALGDADGITTVRGRGYRFDGDVEDVTGESDEAPAAVADVPPVSNAAPVPHPEAPTAASRRAGWRTVAVVVALGTVLTAGAAWWVQAPRSMSNPTNDAGRPLGRDSANAAAAREHAAGAALARENTRVSYLRAAEHFEAATRLDPEYAGAWAGLSEALTMLHIYGAAASPTMLPRSRDAAARAVALDPTLADAHSAMAHVLEQFDRDWAAADASHRRALALDPTDGRLQERYSLFLVSQLRTAESLAASDRAIALQPGVAAPLVLRGVALVLAGRPEDALVVIDEAETVSPGSSLANYFRAVALMELGRLDEALSAAVSAGAGAGNEPTVLIGVIHARAGRRDDAREVWRALERKAEGTYVPPTDFASLATALGDHDAAVEWLERGANDRARYMASINVQPLYRALHGHPRFIALTRRLGLKLPEDRVSASHLPPS
jgi:DNA-binding winged helix-turn-helix (wHTH) protein/tetratricopeptide (TPR) repeat protein